MVQVIPCLFDTHLIYSRCQAYLVCFSKSVSCAQSRDQSAPVYQSGCFEAPSLESIGLVYSRKAHILAIMLKPTPSGLTLRNACILCSVRSSSFLYPIVTRTNFISLAASVRPSCVMVIRPMCARISLISHSSCLTALIGVGNVHARSAFVLFQGLLPNVPNQVSPDAMVYCYPWFLQSFTVALYVPYAFSECRLVWMESLA